tara:strand:- start:2545 stop:3210 length:666 start_codon:yes stop_codon:yes gene_type:complete
MPCLVNPSILTPTIVAGDVDLTFGTDNERDCPYTNFYDYGYNCFFYTASELSAIPNGATIDKIAFEIEAPSNGVFEVNFQEVWLAQHDTGTEFPSNMRVNGTSSSDTTWNNNFINYTKIYNGDTLGFTKVSADPNIVWRDLLFPTAFTWTANKPLCLFWLNGDGDYNRGGVSTYPRAKGDNLSGAPPRYYAVDEQDNTPYTATSFVNINLTFRPNIKIFYS